MAPYGYNVGLAHSHVSFVFFFFSHWVNVADIAADLPVPKCWLIAYLRFLMIVASAEVFIDAAGHQLCKDVVLYRPISFFAVQAELVGTTWCLRMD